MYASFVARRLAQLGVTGDRLVLGSAEECDRTCLAIVTMGGPLCGERASWVCCDQNKTQWFACEAHAAQHGHVRIRVGVFMHFARRQLALPRETWHASPRAPAWVQATRPAASN